MPRSGDSFSYSSGTFPQFDHTSLAEAHANWKEWKPVMQSAMHSVVLGHILAGANFGFHSGRSAVGVDLQRKIHTFLFTWLSYFFAYPRTTRTFEKTTTK